MRTCRWAFILRVFGVMRRADGHVFQVLTKRAGRLAECAGKLSWPGNVWMGVSVENEDYLGAGGPVAGDAGGGQVPVVLEPLLGPVPGLDLDGD